MTVTAIDGIQNLLTTSNTKPSSLTLENRMVTIRTSSFNAAFCIYVFYMILSVNRDHSLEQSKKKNMFVMVTDCVLFEVRTEVLNII
jgi:hypothetical protein